MPTSAVNRRFIGVLIAVAIAYATVLIPKDAAGSGPISALRGLGLVGAPVVALLAWWLTRWVAGATWRVAVGIGIGMGVLAALLGVLEIAYVQLLLALAAEPDADGTSVTGALVIALIGLPYATLALPITVPCGVLWAVIVRTVFPVKAEEQPGAPSSVGPAHVFVALVVVAVGAALVPLVDLS